MYCGQYWSLSRFAYAMAGANYKSFFTLNNTHVRFGWCAQYKGIVKYVGNVTTRKISTSTKRTHTYANNNKNNTNAQEKKQEQKDMIGIECESVNSLSLKGCTRVGIHKTHFNINCRKGHEVVVVVVRQVELI